jgi:hypothetical protein
LTWRKRIATGLGIGSMKAAEVEVGIDLVMVVAASECEVSGTAIDHHPAYYE